MSHHRRHYLAFFSFLTIVHQWVHLLEDLGCGLILVWILVQEGAGIPRVLTISLMSWYNICDTIF